MSSAAQAEVVAALDVTDLGEDRFGGAIPDIERDSPWNLYGGHLIGQSLAAACRTVDADLLPHSLHAYFLRAASTTEDLVHEVTRVRDGRSFTHRRVLVTQGGVPVFEMTGSFQRDEPGRRFEQAMPVGVPDPASLPGLPELVAGLDEDPFDEFWTHRPRPVDLRYVHSHFAPRGPSEDRGIRLWMRTFDALPDDPHLHACMLAYNSDESISDNVLIPHGVAWGEDDEMHVASLDHAMWFHQPLRIDDWLLLDQAPVATAGARGLSTGRVWDRQGRLVATIAQEAVMRLD